MSKTAELAHLFRALKAPAAARALPVLADRAREEQRSYERFAEILLGTEVSARESRGGEGHITAARFPARQTLEEFDFTVKRWILTPLRISIQTRRRDREASMKAATRWVV